MLAVVGEVDHGKSTLIGRLLCETNAVADMATHPLDTVQPAEQIDIDYAFLLDALAEERAQNITIDTTRARFRSNSRWFTIVDVPGHREFLGNMISGAAAADAAILVVDASQGVGDQTVRHSCVLSFLGVNQVIVAVNKMDLVGYSESSFARIREAVISSLAQRSIIPLDVVPISAKHGEGLVRSCTQMRWYSCPCLVASLDRLERHRGSDKPLRFVVQDIYRFEARRIVVGRLDGGTLSTDDAIAFFPGGVTSRVKSIESWPAHNSDLFRGPVSAPHSVAITLEDELFIQRGFVGAPPSLPPHVKPCFVAWVFWLGRDPLRVGEVLPLRLGTQDAEVSVAAIEGNVDQRREPGSEPLAELKRFEFAEVRLQSRRPLVFDCASQVPELARLVLMQGQRISGAGVVIAPERPEMDGRPADVRSVLLGHNGAVIWLTGLSGSGKSTLSAALAQRLLQAGVLSAVLDGDVMRAGLCCDLSYSDEDREENIRRVGEAALLLAQAGVVVVVALISPFRAARQAVSERCRASGVRFAEVFVNAPLTECERRDPKQLYRRARVGEIPNFTGIGSPYEPPLNPTLELRTDTESPGESLDKLASLAFALAHSP